MISLLWPGGRPAADQLNRLSDQCVIDLELGGIADAVAADRPDRRPAVLDALTHLPRDGATTAWRAGLCADLLEAPLLCDRLEAANRALRRLASHRPQLFAREAPRAARIGARVVELEALVEATTLLLAALDPAMVKSPALLALRAELQTLASGPEFKALAAELPRWRTHLDEIRSVTVGINVSGALEPESAMLLGFSGQPVGAADSALTAMLGQTSGDRARVRLFRRQPVDWHRPDPPPGITADVAALLEAVAAPVERALHGFRLVHAQELTPLEDELVLFCGAARMARRWRALGLPCCLAEVETGNWAAIDAYHPVLAESLAPDASLVTNDITFGSDGGIWVLTGPNRGGKTTYLRAAGIVQVLGQCGLPVPARSAGLWPSAQLLTHFPLPEAGRPGQGRLDEEADRVAAIFAQCTPRSLVLLNEVLAGTSAPEGIALATDVLRGFRAIGCAVIYATHLHELAARTEEINASVPGPGTVASLTVQVTEDRDAHTRQPTYRIRPGRPDGASFFASQIARQHGISLPQILEQLRARGVLPDGG